MPSQLLKRIVLFYFSTFLVLDTIMGFMLVYLGLRDSILINPGQLVRSILLILLFGVLLKDITVRLNSSNSRTLLAIIYFILFIVIAFFSNTPFRLLVSEINNVSKLTFILLLIYYVYKHKYYFLGYFDKIMFINMIIITANLFLGYFTDLGISTYDYAENATKGFIFSGNAVSILTLVFFVYFLFKIPTDSKAKYFTIISVFNLYMVGTKAIFIVPVIIALYLFTKVKWTPAKVALTSSVTIPLIILFVYFIAPVAVDVFEGRYLEIFQKTGIQVSPEEGAASGNGATEALLAYRRIAFTIEQVNHQIKHPLGLIFGYGESGQFQFWSERNTFFKFAAMDFFDFLFEYGLVGCLFFYSFIFHPLFSVFNKREFNPLSVCFIFIFLYSFFGGYVIYNSTAGTMFSLLIALNTPKTNNTSNKICLDTTYTLSKVRVAEK